MSDVWYTTDVDDADTAIEDELDRLVDTYGIPRRYGESDAELRARMALLLTNRRPTLEGIRNAIGDLRGVYRATVNEVHADGHALRLDVRVTAMPDAGIEHFGELHGEIEATLRDLVPVGVPWDISIEHDEREREYRGIGDPADRRGRW